MSECTPGPWGYFKSVVGYYSVRQVHPCEPQGVWIPVAEVLDTHAGTGEANARLIAAAPELREACEAIADAGFPFDWDDYPETSPRLRKLLKAAIAKARGEQP